MKLIACSLMLVSVASLSAEDDSSRSYEQRGSRQSGTHLLPSHRVDSDEDDVKIRKLDSTDMEWIQLGNSIEGEEAGDESGSSISFSDDLARVAVGARFSGDNGFRSGHVRIFEKSSGNWTQLGHDIEGESPGDRSGSSVALSGDGFTVAIGSPFSNEKAGHVRIFEYINNAWEQLGPTIRGEAGGDYSGWSLAVAGNGTRVAIGAHYNGVLANPRHGHVRVYEYGSGNWTQLGSDIDGERREDLSGISIAFSSDASRVAIGAMQNSGKNQKWSGHVRVYEFTSGAWLQLGSDIDGASKKDYSGTSVSLSSDGSTIAVGAHSHDGNEVSNSGHVRIYEYNNSGWSQLGADIFGEAEGDKSGSSVSLSASGTRVAIGAYLANDSHAGHVRVYEYSSGDWLQLGADIDGETAGDNSGWSVALAGDGSTVAVGAKLNDGNGSNSGHVRIFSLLPAGAPPTAPSRAPTATPLSAAPTIAPLRAPTASPLSVSPTRAPSAGPTKAPSVAPTDFPSALPTLAPPISSPLTAPPSTSPDMPSKSPLPADICQSEDHCNEGQGTRIHFEIFGFCFQSCVDFFGSDLLLEIGGECGGCD